MFRRARSAWVLASLLVAGCGGSVGSDGGASKGGHGGSDAGTGGSGATGGAGASGGVGASAGTGGSGAVAGTGGSAGTVSSDCDALANAISAKVDPGVGACTALVRVGFVSNTITGYKIICGPYGQITESAAYDKAKADTGIGDACFAASSITGPNPADSFVFFQPASAAQCACCGDGWVTAVNARAGVTTLGATITLGGTQGGIVYPATWDPPSDLGVDCGLSMAPPQANGYDLTELGFPNGAPGPVDPQQLEAVMNVVWNTALPLGLEKKGYIFGADVLHWSPIAGVHETSEWIVLLSSGWLE